MMLKILRHKYLNFISKFFLVTLIFSAFTGLAPNVAVAASVTSFSDVLSRIQASTNANHEIKFVSPQGVQGAETIIITFTGFNNVTNIVHTDIDFAEGNSNNCSTASFTEKTLAATPSGATWGADGDSATTVTITSGTDTVTADRCIRIKIGTNATSQATGVNQIQNNTVGTGLVALTGTFGDTGTAAIPIITDDTVTITATVDPTISFSLSDTTLEFGTLTSGAARWADDSAGNAAAVAGHNFQIGTNAQSGYIVTYNGTTLTKGADKIDVATIAGDADGTPGTEQFAISLNRTSGDGTTVADYSYGSNNYKFVETTTTTIYSETGPTATETVDVYYLTNIAANTPAGSYQADVTYIATGTF